MKTNGRRRRQTVGMQHQQTNSMSGLYHTGHTLIGTFESIFCECHIRNPV